MNLSRAFLSMVSAFAAISFANAQDITVFNLGTSSNTRTYGGSGPISYNYDTGGGPDYTVNLNWGTTNQTTALYPGHLSAAFGSADQYTITFGSSTFNTYNVSDELERSFFYVSNAAGVAPTNVGTFAITGFSPTDQILVQFATSQNRALTVTVGGLSGNGSGPSYTVLTPGTPDHTLFGTGVGNYFTVGTLSGASSYNGTFTNLLNGSGLVAADGEADLSALRFVVTSGLTPIPEPSTIAGSVVLAGFGFVSLYRARRRKVV